MGAGRPRRGPTGGEAALWWAAAGDRRHGRGAAPSCHRAQRRDAGGAGGRLLPAHRPRIEPIERVPRAQAPRLDPQKRRPCAPRSKSGLMFRPSASPSKRAWARLTRTDWCSSMRVECSPTWCGSTPARPKGQRACGSAPAGRWQRLTVLGALVSNGVAAAMSIAAATDTAVFLAFLDHVLIPALRTSKPDAVVVMDNLSAHKARAGRERLEAAGLELLYLPRYSPDLSPIEPMWSKLKMRSRAAAARTLDALDVALAQRPQHHHAPGRPRLVQALRLRSLRQLIRNPL